MNGAALHIVTYHYVRDLPRTPFPRIKGMLLSSFEKQVDQLCAAYEMATLDSAVAFLNGTYHPSRDLCLLTFDDGLKEHFAEVTPLLHERGVQGIFHVITGCLEEHRMAPVHMNHFLMAKLDFKTYKRSFFSEMEELTGDAAEMPLFDPEVVRNTYSLDTQPIAEFKYFFNFILESGLRDRVVTRMFEAHLGDPAPFAEGLYLNWNEALQMQGAGMVIGGHTHEHRPLATLPEAQLDNDTKLCRELLRTRLADQPLWPFCYPYGRQNSFNTAAVRSIQREGFDCAFTTVSGLNQPGTDLYRIHRVDCNQAWVSRA